MLDAWLGLTDILHAHKFQYIALHYIILTN
jgi:hypothetical protein